MSGSLMDMNNLITQANKFSTNYLNLNVTNVTNVTKKEVDIKTQQKILEAQQKHQAQMNAILNKQEEELKKKIALKQYKESNNENEAQLKKNADYAERKKRMFTQVQTVGGEDNQEQETTIIDNKNEILTIQETDTDIDTFLQKNLIKKE